MVLSYTDSLSESQKENGELISPQGVCDLLQDIDVTQPELIVPALLSKIRGLNAANLSSDDTTVMLLKANGTGVRFIENFKAPFRLLRAFHAITEVTFCNVSTFCSVSLRIGGLNTEIHS